MGASVLPRLLAMLLCLQLATSALTATPDHRLDQLSQEIDGALREASPEFGGAVIIEVDGKPVLARGYGYANREARTPFTTDTIAQIGSITKTFTALAIVQLALDGRIDLSASVRTYLPDAPEPAASRTIDQLLTHTGGLLDTCGDDFDSLSKTEFLHDCMSRALENEPGPAHYSNANYTLLAAVIEAVSGGSWEDYQRHHIWRPLGMSSTGYTSFDEPDSRFAWGYKGGKTYRPISFDLRALNGNDWVLRGNGGMQSSAQDMMTFLRALTSGHEGLDNRARQLILSPHRPAVKNVAWGYGWLFRYFEDGRLHRVLFSGSDGIFYSYIAWYPGANARVYFVSNSGEQDAIKLFQRNVQIPLERALGVIK